MDFLMMLEPRFIPKGQVVSDEMEETEEIIFIRSGNIDVAYKINNKP